MPPSGQGPSESLHFPSAGACLCSQAQSAALPGVGREPGAHTPAERTQGDTRVPRQFC